MRSTSFPLTVFISHCLPPCWLGHRNEPGRPRRPRVCGEATRECWQIASYIYIAAVISWRSADDDNPAGISIIYGSAAMILPLGWSFLPDEGGSSAQSSPFAAAVAAGCRKYMEKNLEAIGNESQVGWRCCTLRGA